MCKAGNELQGPALKTSKDEGPDGRRGRKRERAGRESKNRNEQKQKGRRGRKCDGTNGTSRTNRGVLSCWDWVEPKGWMELDLLQERMKGTREQEEEAGNRERGVVVVS